jgi:PRC-barrel domain
MGTTKIVWRQDANGILLPDKEATMLRSMKDLMGFTIGATDGDIGRVDAWYFDDATFTVRHLVVDTGGWLGGRKVLISPMALRDVD